MGALPRRSRSRSRRYGEDRISGLPDELLHGVLARLGSASAAARTSVLARRWRHLWRHLPELVLDNIPDAPPPPPGSVDSNSTAPTLERLSISLSNDHGFRIRPGRVAPWLRFAAESAARELFLSKPTAGGVGSLLCGYGEELAVLELPACGRARKINISLDQAWRLRIGPGSLFTALTSLTIHHCRMGGGELTSLVCAQCPRLRDLALVLALAAISDDITVRSGSLRSLWFSVRNTRRLEVVTPGLEELTVCGTDTMQAHVSAPKLVKVAWIGGAYDPHLHRFADVGRRLQLLEIRRKSVLGSLIRQFDEAVELRLEIRIPKGIEGYESFVSETNELPKCKTFKLFLARDHHGLLPGMLHLLRTCNSLRKLSLVLLGHGKQPLMDSCPLSCPCRLEDSRQIGSTALNSLEEVEISGFTNSHDKVEFVEFLCSNAAILKKLVISYIILDAPPITKEVCDKIRSICHPNVEVEFYSYHDYGGRVRFD